MNYLSLRQIQQPHTLDILEVCLLNDDIVFETILPIFSKACEIVDAQFYYTNPLLFVLVDESGCIDFAKLFDKYYLIPPKLYNSLELNTECIAVNATFVKRICSLSQFSPETPGLNTPNKTLEVIDETAYSLTSLFRLYQEKGLYIIGISTP